MPYNTQVLHNVLTVGLAQSCAAFWASLNERWADARIIHYSLYLGFLGLSPSFAHVASKAYT